MKPVPRAPGARHSSGEEGESSGLLHLGSELLVLALAVVAVIGGASLLPGADALGHPTRDLFDHLALLDAWFFHTTDWRYPEGGRLVPPDLFGMVFASPFLGLGRGTAYNAALAIQLTLASWTAWLLCRRHGSGLVGGLAFGLSPFLLGQALSGEAETVAAWPLPLLLLGLEREDHRGAALAGVAAALAAVGSWYYGAFSAIVLGAWLLWRGRPWSPVGTPGAALAPAVFLALVAVPALVYARELVHPDQLFRGPTMAAYLSEQPRALASMSTDLAAWLGSAPAGANHVDRLGGLVPVLALLGAVSLWRTDRRRAAAWLGLLGGAMVLALGPVLHVAGEPIFAWMPGRLLAALPGFGLMRLPHRWMVVVTLVLAVLAARAARHSPLLVVVLLGVELHWFTRPPTTSLVISPPVVHELVEGPTLELPMRTIGDDLRGRYLLWQREHGQPTPYSLLMTGWSPRVAEEPLVIALAALDERSILPRREVEARQFRQEAFARAVRLAQKDDLEQLSAELPGARDRLGGLGIQTVVLHLGHPFSPSDDMIALLLTHLGEPAVETKEALLWRL